MTRETPTINKECKMMIMVTVVSVVTFDKSHNTTIMMMNPGVTNPLGPYLSKIRPVIGDMIPFRTPPGKRTSPAVKAANAIPVCRYIGKRIMEDRMTMKARKTVMSPNVNIGYFITLKSIIGFSIFNCLNENKSRPINPTMSVIKTMALPHPLSPAILKPYTIPPKPIVDKIIDGTSIFGLVIGETFCI